jgi:hypothetical protein
MPLPRVCHAQVSEFAKLAPCRCTAQYETVLLQGQAVVRSGDFCGPEFYGRKQLASLITISVMPVPPRVLPGDSVPVSYRFENCADVATPIVIRSRGGLASPIRTTFDTGGPLPVGECGLGSSGVDYHVLVVVEPKGVVELRIPWRAARRHGVLASATDCRFEERPLDPGRYMLEPEFQAVDLPSLPSVNVEVDPSVP